MDTLVDLRYWVVHTKQKKQVIHLQQKHLSIVISLVYSDDISRDGTFRWNAYGKQITLYDKAAISNSEAINNIWDFHKKRI